VSPIAEEPEVIKEVIKDPIEEPENPPGFLSHADYVEKHGNDDRWRGKGAYSAEYDRIQDNKELRGEIKQLGDVLQVTVDASKDMQTREYERGLAEANDRLDAAIEADDVTEVLKARDEIDNLKPLVVQPQGNQLHDRFFSANPVLDTNNQQYNQEFRAEFERIYHDRLRADGVGVDQQLTERAVNGYMRQALESTKGLFPELSESPKNSRSTTQTTQRRTQTKADPTTALKEIKSSKNPRDTSPAMDMYNELLSRPDGEKHAKAFAERMNLEVGA